MGNWSGGLYSRKKVETVGGTWVGGVVRRGDVVGWQGGRGEAKRTWGDEYDEKVDNRWTRRGVGWERGNEEGGGGKG